MPALFDELFSAGLDQVFDVHARDVDYRPGESADWRTVRGIYNPSHERADTDGNMPVLTHERILDLLPSEIDFEPEQQGHKVRIDGTEFDVIEVRPRKRTWRLILDRSSSW